MNTPTDIQIIKGSDGLPAFEVIPYERFAREYGQERDLIPNEVVRRNIMDNMPMARASWPKEAPINSFPRNSTSFKSMVYAMFLRQFSN